MSVYRVGGNKSSQNIFPSVRPTLDLDFANSKTLDPRITFTRASGGSYTGADGLIKYAGVNEARFDHDPETGESLGLLVEEARTNSIPNSTAQGAIFGSPGTVPTGWFSTAGGISGLNREIVSTGTEDGIPYVDIRYSGTTLTNSAFNILPSFTTAIPAASGQTWTGSAYIKLQSGSTANFSTITASVNGRTSSNLSTEVTNLIYTPTTAPLREQRRSVTHTMGNASTERVTTTVFSGSFPSGVFIDITLRIGLPQLEQGAFATSVIPTTTSTRTRAADTARIIGKNFSEWYRQDEGTVFVSHKALEGLKNRVTGSLIYNISNGPTFLSFFYNTNSDKSDIFVFGREYGDLVRFQQNQPTRNKVIFAYNAPSSDYSPYIDGAKITVITATKPYKPSNYDTLTLTPTPSMFNGTISRLTYFPKRLPNEQLIALTR